MGTDAGKTDRRVRRTRRVLQEAFVALVLERGYDNVTIEDIAERADVARQTFYAHYGTKEDLLSAVFMSMVGDLRNCLPYREGPWDAMRTDAMEKLYRHAAEFRDIYRVCLHERVTRDAFLGGLIEETERNFSARIAALGITPRVPVAVMARAWAGAQLTLMQSLVDGDIQMPPEELADQGLHLMAAGAMWGHGSPLRDIERFIASLGDSKGEAQKD